MSTRPAHLSGVSRESIQCYAELGSGRHGQSAKANSRSEAGQWNGAYQEKLNGHRNSPPLHRNHSGLG